MRGGGLFLVLQNGGLFVSISLSFFSIKMSSNFKISNFLLKFLSKGEKQLAGRKIQFLLSSDGGGGGITDAE